MKLLLVEDEKELSKAIKKVLEINKYEVDTAYNGLEALELIEYGIYDAIILDIMMPKADGLTVVKKMRKAENNTPVLMLTAKAETDDKVLGLDAGADDYLTKPFSYNELNSRVKALLRRYHIYQGKDHSTKQESVLSIGKLKLDTNLKTAFKAGKEILLTDIEYQILLFFAQHKNTVYSLAEIYENIWQEKYYYGANNTVMVHIRNLRKKIEDDPSYPTVIKTSWGKGYYSE